MRLPILVLLLATLGCAMAAPYKDGPGPFAVDTLRTAWTDAARGRTLPVKVYYPKTGDGPFPVIVFSHGLGGSCEGYQFQGERWASHGYVSVHIQHPGSDSAVLQGAQPLQAMRRAAADPRNAIDRPLDVKFALDQVTKLDDDGPLRHRLDLRHIGLAGHSFGGYTTLAVAGMALNGRQPFRDPRVTAAIAESAPANAAQVEKKTYDAIAIPLLHMTGTKDDSPIGDTKAADRRLPFDHITAADQYLLIFTGGDHMVFSGRGRLTPAPTDARFHALILQATTAFWDAYLKGDAAAKSWLTDACAAELGTDGTWEGKAATKK